MLLLLVVLIAQELGDEAKEESAGFALRPPAGWTRKAHVANPNAIQYAEPTDAPDGGLLLWELRPTIGFQTPKELMAALIADAKKADVELLSDEEVSCGGRLGRLATTRRKLSTIWWAVIPLGPKEHLVADLGCVTREEKAGRQLFDKVLGSLRTWAPKAVRDAATDKAVKELRFSAALLRESFTRGVLNKKAVSRERFLLRTAKVNGADGYEYEIEEETFDLDRPRRRILAKGALADGAGYFKESLDETYIRDGKERVCKTVLTFEKGRCAITRDLDGSRGETTFEIDGPCLPWTLLDLIYAQLSLGSKGKRSVAVLLAFYDRPIIVAGETTDPEVMKVQDVRRSARIAFFEGRTLILGEDGTLLSKRWPSGHETLPCTKEEWERAK